MPQKTMSSEQKMSLLLSVRSRLDSIFRDVETLVRDLHASEEEIASLRTAANSVNPPAAE